MLRLHSKQTHLPLAPFFWSLIDKKRIANILLIIFL